MAKDIYADIHNYNEELVKRRLDELWENNTYCKCDECRRNVFTLALNMMTPHYTDSHKGEMFTRLASWDRDEYAEIVKVLNQAMVKVGENPKHTGQHAPARKGRK